MSPPQTRISAKKSSSIPTGPKYTPAPVLQPKSTKKPDAQLPEWQPDGGSTVSPLQRLLDSNAAQAKLTIGQPNDKYEQEADAVAQDVVQRINSPVSETQQPETVQRETEEAKDELQMKPMVQRVQAVRESEAPSEVESGINQAKGSGQRLDNSLQRSMGQAMNADFSGVRIHTDHHADQLNQSIQAKAFTTRQDLFFKKGEYNPGSRDGQELIAHELTHVVQQSGNFATISSKTNNTGTAIQRQLEKFEGKSSGILKGNRDKINEMIDKYNLSEIAINQEEKIDQKRLHELAQIGIKDLFNIQQKVTIWLEKEKNKTKSKKPEKIQNIEDWYKDHFYQNMIE